MKSYLKTKDYFHTQEEFELLYDSEYEMLVTHPQPKDLAPYYNNDNYISHSDSRAGLLSSIYQLVKNYSIKRKLKLINSFNTSDKSLLDIGAGTGDFILETKNNGWNVYGVEPNLKAQKKAAQKGLRLETSLTDLGKAKFDVITLWHVLEHLPNLSEQIKTITSLLKDNGTLVIAVPNFRSYDAQKYKSFWAAFDVPRHLWHFSRKSIPLLFSEYGLKVTNTQPMLFDAYYVSLLSEKYKFGKTSYLKAFYSGFVSNIKAMSSKEHSSIIYVLNKTEN